MPDSPPNAEPLLLAALAGYKRPRVYRFVAEPPLTATAKKMHYQVRDMAVADGEAGLLIRP